MIASLTRAVGADDKLGCNEALCWLLPERERPLAALLATGRAAGAVWLFRAALVMQVGIPRAPHGV